MGSSTEDRASLPILGFRQLSVLLKDIMAFNGVSVPRSISAGDVKFLAHSYSQSRLAMIDLVNLSIRTVCSGCGAAYGENPETHACEDHQHGSIYDRVGFIARTFTLHRCGGCGKVTQDPSREGAMEPGTVTDNHRRWFCWTCWHKLFDKRG